MLGVYELTQGHLLSMILPRCFHLSTLRYDPAKIEVHQCENLCNNTINDSWQTEAITGILGLIILYRLHILYNLR